jgi:hypothetical protein
VAITWRAGSLGRTAEVATVECSAITPPPMPACRVHQSPGFSYVAEVVFTQGRTTAHAP